MAGNICYGPVVSSSRLEALHFCCCAITALTLLATIKGSRQASSVCTPTPLEGSYFKEASEHLIAD